MAFISDWDIFIYDITWDKALGTNHHLSVVDTVNELDLENVLIRPHLTIYSMKEHVMFVFRIIILLFVESRIH